MGGALPRTIAELEPFLPPRGDAATCLLGAVLVVSEASVLASALSPLGAHLWAHGGAQGPAVTPYRSRLPVICVGNFTAGGGGKTPTAIAVAKC